MRAAAGGGKVEGRKGDEEATRKDYALAADM